MRWCKGVDFLFRILPFTFLKDYLIRFHVVRCRHCRAALVSSDEARSLLYSEEDFKEGIDLWPRVGRELKASVPWKRAVRMPLSRGGFLAGAAALLLACLLLVWNVLVQESSELRTAEEGFRIRSIQIDNEPAQAFLYQPSDSDMVFVWVEKNKNEEIYYE
jgi:hypothetical protein